MTFPPGSLNRVIIRTQTPSTPRAGSACSPFMSYGHSFGSGRWLIVRSVAGDFLILARPPAIHPKIKASWKTFAGALRSLRPSSRRKPNNGTPADPDLRVHLLRDLQAFQNPGKPMVTLHGGIWRHRRHRAAAAGDELQSSFYQKCADLFFSDP